MSTHPAPSRGRPYRPLKASPLDAIVVQRRVGWLLRTCRLYGIEDGWSTIAAFATAFPGGSHGSAVSVSTISRWETGVVRATYAAVRRYEELLDLPPGLLAAAADTIYRYAAPAGVGPPTLDRGALHGTDSAAYHRLEDLIDRARSNDLVSGAEWDELTGRICALPDLVIVPRTIWAELAERVLSEMIIADGVAWLQRFEALNRLLGHPVGQEAAIAALASSAADSTNEVFVETVCAFDASRHPDAARHVLAQLTNPTNERARYGALLACVRKVAYNHFTPDQRQGLVPMVRGFVDDPDLAAGVRTLAVHLLRRFASELPSDARVQLRQALRDQPMLVQVFTAGRLAAAETARIVIDRVVAAATAGLPREIPAYADDLVSVLVEEMLYDPVFDIRLYAAMLLYATPYRAPMAAALASELARAVGVRDTNLAASILGGLRFLGGPAERPIVERLVLAAGLPGEVTVAAAEQLGHVGGRSDAAFWHTALDQHGRRWRRHHDRASAETLRALVYGLGMAHEDRLLARVRADGEAPPPVRASASWWVSHPRRIRESAMA